MISGAATSAAITRLVPGDAGAVAGLPLESFLLMRGVILLPPALTLVLAGFAAGYLLGRVLEERRIGAAVLAAVVPSLLVGGVAAVRLVVDIGALATSLTVVLICALAAIETLLGVRVSVHGLKRTGSS
ncbi:hypothetical protein JYT22_00790 [Endomicrobium sp. AH-315-J14]|nr:hypothetical protein [Endomicrobium sp. AH-315-J14]